MRLQNQLKHMDKELADLQSEQDKLSSLNTESRGTKSPFIEKERPIVILHEFHRAESIVKA